MKKLFIVVFVSILTIGFAWSGHSALTFYVLSGMDKTLDELISITPYNYYEIDQREYNPEILPFRDYLGEVFVPVEDLGLFRSVFDNKIPVDAKAPAWQILCTYSYEPDLGMDKNLELSGLETVLGDSQGTRHMEYRLGLIKVGNVTTQPSYFAELSRTAWLDGDAYWALRFMARGVHYMEDAGQPFHAFPAPICSLVNMAFDFDKWTAVFANYHFAYDYYGGYLLWKGYPPLVEAIRDVEPKVITDPEKAARELRRFSRMKLNAVYQELRRLMKTDLETASVFTPDTAYFDNLVATGETERLDALTVEILEKTAAYVKGYINYLAPELN